MRYMPQPPYPELATYDRLSASHTDPNVTARLTVVRPIVDQVYQHYESSDDVTRLISSQPLSLVGTDLEQNYTALRTGSCNDVGLSLLDRSTICCLCGDRNVGQLDHFLPKRVFPEFSALTANLIPVCPICNQRKGKTYRRADGGPAFLHPYRDPLPDEQFLVVKIEIDTTSVTPFFDVIKTAGMASAVFDTLQHQFKRLRIGSLYGDEATAALNEKRGALYDYFDDNGAASLRKYLMREANSARHAYGANHWKPVLLDGLAKDDDFCNEGFTVLGRPESVTRVA